jgi:hypothetical protein
MMFATKGKDKGKGESKGKVKGKGKEVVPAIY